MDKSGKKQLDVAMMQVASVIFCTFVPRNEDEIRDGIEPELVFGEEDFEDLLSKPSGDITDKLGEVSLPMLNVANDQEAAKNS